MELVTWLFAYKKFGALWLENRMRIRLKQAVRSASKEFRFISDQFGLGISLQYLMGGHYIAQPERNWEHD